MRIDDRATDLSAEEGARVVALGLLEEAIAAADAMAAGTGEEPLHDFRVALRRLRSALRTFRPWLEDGVRRRHEKELKRIARSTNEARDAEVQLAWLATKREALASSRQRPGYELLVARLEEQAHRGPDAARVAGRFRRAAEKLERRLRAYERKVEAGGDARATFGGVFASLVGDQVSALSERMDAIRGPLDQEGVHRARIEGKRLRYLLEPLRGHARADASDVIGHLKRLQDVLGDLHDTHVLAGELREALADVAAEEARQLHAARYAQDVSDVAIRDRARAGPRAGLLALLRLVCERRDALYADLERECRTGGMDALAAEARAVAAALDSRERRKLVDVRRAAARSARRRSRRPVRSRRGRTEERPRPAPSRRSRGCGARPVRGAPRGPAPSRLCPSRTSFP
ncbi:MAG TPA: CHAD domain-containing protein [Anaeromyxobacter sp.]